MRLRLGNSANSDSLRKIIVILLVVIFVPNTASKAQATRAPQPMSSDKDFRDGRIHGLVKEGTIPLSGVRVIATGSRSRKKFSTITDGAGAYAINLPSNGSYSIRAVFRALTSPAREVVFTATSRDQQVDFSFEGTAAGNSLSSLWPAPLMPPVVANALSLQPAESNAGGNSGAQFPTFAGDAVFSGDSFSITGQPPIVIPYFQMADQMRQDFEDGHELQGPSMQPSQGGLVTDSKAVNDETPVPGNQNTGQIHGSIFWNGGYSVLNAKPYLLAGESAPNPSYNSNNYGLTVGGQPYIPGLTKPSAKDSVLLSFSRLLSSSLASDYGIVPTDAERKGDFSQLMDSTGALIPIYNPRNSAPFPNNTIDTPLDSAATAILQYLPEPNLPAAALNYHLLTTQGNHTTTLGVSYTHDFGAPGGQIVNDEHALIQSFDVNFNLADIAADIINIFPQLGGKQTVRGYALTAGYSALKGEWGADLNVIWTRNDSQISNHFTNGEDVATQVGVLFGPGVPLNSNPLNYGLPNLVFNNFTGMSQTQPNFQLTQTTGVSGSGTWSHGSHIIRLGGDFHRVDFDLFGGTDATGTYVFTGGFTQMPGTSNDNAVATSGSSFADFLLGFPLQTKIEAPDQKAYTRQNNWDLFVRDDWRLLSNLTLIAGLRYDYFSPYVEDQNRLSTLDYNAEFTRIAPVQPNSVGPISGAYYPRTLIYPDRDRFSPHLGFAWQATRSTGVRAGYGINSAVGQYGTFIQNLAYQPPFADVEVNGNILDFFPFIPFTLQNGFANPVDFGNYAVNRNYRLPYVQVWYVDTEQMLPLNIVLDVGYSGAKGTRLDIIDSPGYINNKLPFASAFFDFEDSTAFSNFNALIVRANKRLENGLALQAIYSYSHSIDNASSTNAGSPTIVQNWRDPLAERGNSSFDIRNELIGSFLYQLPFGPKKKYLSDDSWASRILGDWAVSGYFTLAAGVPLTPFIQASVAEVERGTHGSVRPNRVRRMSIRTGGGHIDHWFNTAAFSPNFRPNQRFGTASRNSIPGPGIENVNLSLSKIMPFGETRSLEVRLTANNAFNIVQYAGVNTQFDSTSVGQVDAFQPMRQITFLARFRF